MEDVRSEQTALQRYKLKLSLRYYKLINLLHSPFVSKGERDPYHQTFWRFVELGKAIQSPVVLEIGSRNVTGVSRGDLFPHCAKYVGFDVHPGDGVDVVGDSHQLSTYLPRNNFDLVYTMSVFEHLMFPWKAVLEINKVMKTGGYAFVSTHPAWPAHELPWDFWRFMSGGFQALFNEYTGFELVTVTEGLPCKAYSLVDDGPTRSISSGVMHLGVAAIARKTNEYRSDLLKWDIDVKDITNSMYPNREQSSGYGRQ